MVFYDADEMDELVHSFREPNATLETIQKYYGGLTSNETMEAQEKLADAHLLPTGVIASTLLLLICVQNSPLARCLIALATIIVSANF